MSDAEVVIVGDDGTEHVFPPGFDPKRAAAIVSGQTPQSSVGGLVMAGAKEAIPAVQGAAEAVFTSPTLPATIGRMARAGATAMSPVAGALSGGITGALAGVAAAPKAGWAAGKTGYFGGKLIQDIAEPVAKVAEKSGPYAKGALNTLAAAQSVLDLAQMADPTRRDIGVLGIGMGNERSAAEKKAHPALINAMADAFMRSMSKSPEIWQDVVAAINKRMQ